LIRQVSDDRGRVITAIVRIQQMEALFVCPCHQIRRLWNGLVDDNELVPETDGRGVARRCTRRENLSLCCRPYTARSQSQTQFSFADVHIAAHDDKRKTLLRIDCRHQENRLCRSRFWDIQQLREVGDGGGMGRRDLFQREGRLRVSRRSGERCDIGKGSVPTSITQQSRISTICRRKQVRVPDGWRERVTREDERQTTTHEKVGKCALGCGIRLCVVCLITAQRADEGAGRLARIERPPAFPSFLCVQKGRGEEVGRQLAVGLYVTGGKCAGNFGQRRTVHGRGQAELTCGLRSTWQPGGVERFLAGVLAEPLPQLRLKIRKTTLPQGQVRKSSRSHPTHKCRARQ
jgi:hypothetical protein